MKLFQRLLVAPAALGLMAPVAVNADTAFSSTTTLSGNAVFTVGAADFDAAATNEELHMQYAYTLELDSSFSGSDNLHVGIEAGNASGILADLDSAVTGGADLTVSSLYYSFPVGDIAITGGPLLEADDLIGVTTSSYSEGLITSSLPFSSRDDVGAGIGAAYAPDNGFSVSASILSLDAADATRGINTDTSDDTVTLAAGFNGEGGFGGERGENVKLDFPERSPDHQVIYQTRDDQALIYRLSGDRNPLHSDPSFAKMGGFDRPILHGLCTYGYTGRALLSSLCDSNPGRFQSMNARFSKPVYPGDKLTVSMWVDGNEALFRTTNQDGDVVLDQGRCVFA